MHHFQILKVIGDGSYGTVYQAINKSSNEVVAIKKMKSKFATWDECINLREVKSLKKLSHPNILKLKEVIREKEELHFVMEYMESSLYDKIKGGTPLPESRVRTIGYQIFLGLAYMHKNGFFHRDMKPENLLMNGDVVKIADFGLARETRSRPPFTEYVSTRWYRAPELLLRTSVYSSPVDVWATGAIIAELYTARPLFPGTSETDQLFKTCSLLGTPNESNWPEGLKLAASKGIKFPQVAPTPLRNILTKASFDALDLIGKCLLFDSSKRVSAENATTHKFFSGVIVPTSKPVSIPTMTSTIMSEEMRETEITLPPIPSKANVISNNSPTLLTNISPSNAVLNEKTESPLYSNSSRHRVSYRPQERKKTNDSTRSDHSTPSIPSVPKNNDSFFASGYNEPNSITKKSQPNSFPSPVRKDQKKVHSPSSMYSYQANSYYRLNEQANSAPISPKPNVSPEPSFMLPYTNFVSRKGVNSTPTDIAYAPSFFNRARRSSESIGSKNAPLQSLYSNNNPTRNYF